MWRSVVVPSASWPKALSPQHSSERAAVRTQEEEAPRDKTVEHRGGATQASRLVLPLLDFEPGIALCQSRDLVRQQRGGGGERRWIFVDIETIQGVFLGQRYSLSLSHTHTHPLSLPLCLSLHARMNTLLQQELSDTAGSLAKRNTWTNTACHSLRFLF